MTNKKLTQSSTGLKRCAVCKIDLKGRFVFIDERTETLLGLTSEELFGKTIFEFLDESSRNSFQQVLSQRNNYETFYDTAEICLVNNNSELIKARVVVSLNFNGGNPVNFQIIIDHFKTIDRTEIRTNEAERYKFFIEQLREMGQQKDINRLAEILLYFSAAESVSLYLINGENLEERTAVTTLGDREFAFKNIPPLQKLHYDTALKNSSYSFINPEDVQEAVELYSDAPNEYICRLNIWDNNGYLLRFIFSEIVKPTHAVETVCRIETAVELMNNWYNNNSANQASEDDPEFDIRFVVGFLDNLNIPSLLIDSQGSVVGYNTRVLDFFEKDSVSGSYVNLFNEIVVYNNDEMMPTIINYVTSSSDCNVDDILKLPVKLNKKTSGELVIMKLSDKTLDLSSTIIFLPDRAGSSECSNNIDNNLFNSAISCLKNMTSKQERQLKKFTVDELDLINDSGKKLFNSVKSLSIGMNSKIDQFDKLLNLPASVDNEVTDLNRIVSDSLKQIKKEYPQKEIELTCPNLPKILIEKNSIKMLIGQYLSAIIQKSSINKIVIDISIEINTDTYNLNVTDNGNGADFKKMLSDDTHLADEKIKTDPESYCNASFLKILGKRLDIKISKVRKTGKRNTLTFIIPVKDEK